MTPDLAPLTTRLLAGESLTAPEATAAARTMADPAVPAAAKEDFLRALGAKGETAIEVAAFAGVFRELSRKPPLGAFSARAIDIVGTGGDSAGSFNISTLTSIIVASAGIPVMKHGGRSITSKSGSADLLERLGVDLAADDATHARALSENNYTFLFAPHFHPAFAAVAPVRKALAAEGRKSIFNLLGPLINPGAPAAMLLGVFAESWVAPMADALETLGVPRALVVHGTAPGGLALDELSTCGPSRVRGVGALRDIDTVWAPADFGLETSPFSDLRGGDADENLVILGDLLNGAAPKGLQDTVVFNAGAAFFVAGRTPTVRAGMILAGDLLAHGPVRAQLRRLRDFYRPA